MAPLVCSFVETALKTKCGFTGASPYWDWSKGPGLCFNSSPVSFDCLVQTLRTSMVLAFLPTTHPHRIRWLGRSYSRLPSSFGRVLQLTSILSFPAHPPPELHATAMVCYCSFFPLITDPSFMANVSFTKQEVKKLIGGFVGDFKAFQQYFEAPNV